MGNCLYMGWEKLWGRNSPMKKVCLAAILRHGNQWYFGNQQSEVTVCTEGAKQGFDFCTIRSGSTSFLKHANAAGRASETQINRGNSCISKIGWWAENPRSQIWQTLIPPCTLRSHSTQDRGYSCLQVTHIMNTRWLICSLSNKSISSSVQ